MNGATLQARVYSGYAKAAKRIGQTTAIYRPTDALAPISLPVTSVQAAFAQDVNFSRPNAYGNSKWLGMFDGSLTQVGDYLIGPSGTFFIAAQQHLLPFLCIECNHTVKVVRLSQPEGYGAVGYGGNVAGTETVLMQGWPVSILQGAKGEKNPAGLPNDIRLPYWVALMPAFLGVEIKNTDVLIDETGKRYPISEPELTDLGWRLTVSYAVA